MTWHGCVARTNRSMPCLLQLTHARTHARSAVHGSGLGDRLTAWRAAPRCPLPTRMRSRGPRTPCTPPRWDSFDAEMTAAWTDCLASLTKLRDAIAAASASAAAGASAGAAAFAGQRLDLACRPEDAIGGAAVADAARKAVGASLRVAFFWYHFMPLSRGSASIGFVIFQALLLAGGLEARGPLPQGLQMDWEAILTAQAADFEARMCGAWLYGALHFVQPEVQAQLARQPLTERIPTVRAVFDALSCPIK